jgi:hypothetical protein
VDLNQYASRKQSILSRLIDALAQMIRGNVNPNMTYSDWERFVALTYPPIKNTRDQATSLARDFYDDNRYAQTRVSDRHNIYKDNHYPQQWFSEAVNPTIVDLRKTGNADAAIVDFTNRVTKIVEDGARRTIIKGVETDDRQVIRGFARFDPRPPTCAFCTMMISRGPVYSSAENAGIDLDDLSAEELWEEGDTDAMNAMMNRWHPGCTCIAVPVYKRSGYPSEEQEKAALKLYNEARKRAQEKTFKAILNEMRRLAYEPAHEADEVKLPSVA